MRAGKHTPGPWHTDEPYFIYVWGPEQQMVADLPTDDEEAYLVRMRGVGRGSTPEEQRANAEFIVRACNAHEELLEALKALVDWQGVEHLDGCREDDGCRCPIVAQVNAAIAKAEG